MKKEYLFLLKIKNSDDRDCVAYLKNDNTRISINGACYSCGLSNLEIGNYENIETILTREEFNELLNIEESRKNNFGDYPKDLQNRLQKIIDKLSSNENETLFNKVIEEEKEYCMKEYDLSRKDIDEVFDTYYLDYQDRGIVGCVYNDTYDLGEEEIENCYSVEEHLKNYIDYEKFGEDLVSYGDDYYRLDDNRIVRLNY